MNGLGIGMCADEFEEFPWAEAGFTMVGGGEVYAPSAWANNCTVYETIIIT